MHDTGIVACIWTGEQNLTTGAHASKMTELPGMESMQLS